jgi:acyl phosphate:glycerol-3-phosphate acyltransferase
MTDYHFRALFVVVVCYLLGSIPTAYLIGRLKKIDIFAVGSGNMGATNVSRTLGTGWGLFVWFCDSLKGILAILLARLLMPDSTAAATTIAAISVIVGHNWSLFATLLTGTLRGGKGAATALGTMIIIAPIYVVVATTVLGGLIVARTRYVSLGVLTTFALAMLWIMVRIVQRQEPWEYIFYSLSVVALLLLRFRENIQRLLAGTERRLGERA